MKALYTAVATATGGRNGHVKTDNGTLDLQVRHPKALGGANDDHPNPEQLFAAGYSACFGSALDRVITLSKTAVKATEVTAKVSIGQIENGGFGLSVVLDVNVSGVDLPTAHTLVKKAHQVCPYSNATRNNIDVTLNVTNH